MSALPPKADIGSRPNFGQSGPDYLRPAGGRPPGVRNRLSNKLITDLSDIWHANGPDILRKMAMRDPVQLARLAYATLPEDKKA